MVADPRRAPLRFGVFEVDLEAGELRKHGLRIRLPQQSFHILQVLLEHPGQLISREELQQSLWPADTFVEFDKNLNNAVSRLREALGDVADNPRFVETVPRRGYRFIAPVETARGGCRQPSPGRRATFGCRSRDHDTRAAWKGIAAAVLAVAIVALGGWIAFRPRPASSGDRAQRTIAVLPFVAGDAAEGSVDSYVAFGMTEALITELSRIGALKVISQTSVMQYKGLRKPLKQIASELGAGTIVEGSVLREGDRCASRCN